MVELSAPTQDRTESPSCFMVPFATDTTLQAFVTWLYTEEIGPCPRLCESKLSEGERPGSDGSAADAIELESGHSRLYKTEQYRNGAPSLGDWDDLELVYLIIFAEEYGIGRLTIEALRLFIDCTVRRKRSASAAAINKAYEVLPHGCLLIRFLVDDAAVHAQASNMPPSTSPFCSDYLGDVLRRCLARREQKLKAVRCKRFVQERHEHLTITELFQTSCLGPPDKARKRTSGLDPM